jgi:hypothetical protein
MPSRWMPCEVDFRSSWYEPTVQQVHCHHEDPTVDKIIEVQATQHLPCRGTQPLFSFRFSRRSRRVHDSSDIGIDYSHSVTLSCHVGTAARWSTGIATHGLDAFAFAHLSRRSSTRQLPIRSFNTTHGRHSRTRPRLFRLRNGYRSGHGTCLRSTVLRRTTSADASIALSTSTDALRTRTSSRRRDEQRRWQSSFNASARWLRHRHGLDQQRPIAYDAHITTTHGSHTGNISGQQSNDVLIKSEYSAVEPTWQFVLQ